MTDSLHWPSILNAIENGIRKARADKVDAGEELTDDFTAFVVLRELHRQEWSIVPTDPNRPVEREAG